jgi:hypothetical protein
MKLLRLIRGIAVVVVTLLLVATAALIVVERGWAKPPPPREPQQAFFNGSIGTELMPLVVLQVLPDMFPEHFRPAPQGGDWVEQFGFIRRNPPDPDGLPLGFVASNYRPQSGAPSPVRFVGFSCVLCHSTMVRDGDGTGQLVVGTGNSALNLFGWLDALQAAMLDEKRLTPETIDASYRKKFSRGLTAQEKLIVKLWLGQFRGTLKEGLPRFDEPYGEGQSRDVDIVPTGPGRTQPFRTLVRRVVMRSGANMSVYTKIAPVYNEDQREWAQVDGSVKDLYVRSSLAALAAGATLDNMRLPEIEHNIRAATDYTRKLSGPSFVKLFPAEAAKIDPQAVERGRQMYAQHCASCHGQPDLAGGEWTRGTRQGEIIPLEEIKTDPERVSFRYSLRVPEALFHHFKDYPIAHPFKFARETLRPGPAGTVRGYVTGPIDSVATRMPFLHNASVPTLAQLINLKERPKVFYRGGNLYDKEEVGLSCPSQPDAVNYFRFDTTLPGNSNTGHDYPWPYQDRAKGWNEEKLKDLLEYLKVI